MNENSYEEYKENLSRDQKKHDGFRSGLIRLIIGACFLVYALWVLPLHADNAGQMRGDELRGGKNYYPEKVCYFENLELLMLKHDANDGVLYAIAKFPDRDQREWIISFSTGKDQKLAEKIVLSNSYGSPSSPISGYFLLKPLDELPAEVDSFYTVFSGDFAKKQEILSLHAEYLCPESASYMLQVLLRPGIPLISVVVGLFGVLSGGISLVRNRPGKKEIKEEQL